MKVVSICKRIVMSGEIGEREAKRLLLCLSGMVCTFRGVGLGVCIQCSGREGSVVQEKKRSSSCPCVLRMAVHVLHRVSVGLMMFCEV